MKNLNSKDAEIAKVILANRNQTRWGYSQQAVLDVFPELDRAKISRIAKKIRQNHWKMIPVDEDGDKGKKIVTTGSEQTPTETPMLGFETKAPPLVFQFKQDKIAISTTDLIDCFIIYSEIKTRLNCKQDFSESLKIAMETLWKLTVEPKIDGEGITYG